MNVTSLLLPHPAPLTPCISIQRSKINFGIIPYAAAAAVVVLCSCRRQISTAAACTSAASVHSDVKPVVNRSDTRNTNKLPGYAIKTTYHAAASVSADTSDGAHTLPLNHIRFIVLKDSLGLLVIVKWGDAVADGLRGVGGS